MWALQEVLGQNAANNGYGPHLLKQPQTESAFVERWEANSKLIGPPGP